MYTQFLKFFTYDGAQKLYWSNWWISGLHLKCNFTILCWIIPTQYIWNYTWQTCERLKNRISKHWPRQHGLRNWCKITIFMFQKLPHFFFYTQFAQSDFNSYTLWRHLCHIQVVHWFSPGALSSLSPPHTGSGDSSWSHLLAKTRPPGNPTLRSGPELTLDSGKRRKHIIALVTYCTCRCTMDCWFFFIHCHKYITMVQLRLANKWFNLIKQYALFWWKQTSFYYMNIGNCLIYIMLSVNWG